MPSILVHLLPQPLRVAAGAAEDEERLAAHVAWPDLTISNEKRQISSGALPEAELLTAGGRLPSARTQHRMGCAREKVPHESVKEPSLQASARLLEI